MGSALTAPALPLARLAGVGAVVFLANAALLVLQLVASRLLAPFIGSDLYSWTAIIGVFLTGIALGNAYGGKLADRYPSPRALVGLLAAGAVAAVWMALFPMILTATGGYRAIPLGPRIPLLAAVLCLPAGFVLSLLTPLAIKLGLPDVSKAGRVAGMVFALGTLGCLLGNYVTGFYLVPAFTVNALVYTAAGTLLALAVAAFVVLSLAPPAPPVEVPAVPPGPAGGGRSLGVGGGARAFAFADVRQAFAVVFFASFCGMTLELAASRLISQYLGVSLFTWTGIIGVMLAGTALGNLAGGVLADRVNRPGAGVNPRHALAGTLLAAGATTVLALAVNAVLTRNTPFAGAGLIVQIVTWTFLLFFAPMACLGMVSPQVIRLAVPDVAHAGRVAGRVYAWSTVGAITGTFAAGYVLLSALGVDRGIIAVAAVLCGASLAVAPVWKNNALLYLFSVVMGGITGGVILTWNPLVVGHGTVVLTDTNYYKIRVAVDGSSPRVLNLYLDHLLHSTVDLDDPTFIHYTHEHIQMEFLRAAREGTGTPKVLLIGGGGYTFPRYAKTMLPETEMDVVEIDPGVTRVAYEHLGLPRTYGPRDRYGIHDVNMDGRQFVAERAAPGSYDLVIQDAVNDLSVPWHLLTREYNTAVKAALKPDGVYLLTVIDEIEHGKLWRAAMATLRQNFRHVVLLASVYPPSPTPPLVGGDPEATAWQRYREDWSQRRQVYVIYASDRPLDEAGLRDLIHRMAGFNPQAVATAVGAAGGVGADPVFTHPVPEAVLAPFMEKDPGVILTDQYAPVDNLMAEVFRRR